MCGKELEKTTDPVLPYYCPDCEVLVNKNKTDIKKKKLYVWLKRKGKYYVELGDTDIGNLIRIDNYLDSLEERLIKLKINLEKMKERESDIRRELSKDESYTDQIETYKRKVEELDKKLGVGKK